MKQEPRLVTIVLTPRQVEELEGGLKVQVDKPKGERDLIGLLVGEEGISWHRGKPYRVKAVGRSSGRKVYQYEIYPHSNS